MIRTDGTLATLPRLVVLVLVAVGAWLSLADPFSLLFFVSYALVGALLVTRRPRISVSWLLLLIAFAFLGTTSTPAVDIESLQQGRGSAIDVVWAWVYGWSGYLTFLAFAALAFVFPSGRLPSGRWRGVAAGALLVSLAAIAVSAFTPTVEINVDGVSTIAVPNAFSIAPDLPIWGLVPAVPLVLVLASLVLGVGSLVARHRQAVDVTRLQIRWLLAATVAVLVAVVLGLTLTLVAGDALGGVVWLPAIVAYPTVPIAIGIAIFRYRLFDLDRIVNRALVYGAVTAILAGVFAALTAVSQRAFIVLTGQTSDAGVVLTTLAVATLYTPVRKRVEQTVDQVFKYETRQFGAYRDDLTHLLELIDPTRAAARLAREVVSETGARAVAVLDASGAVLASEGPWPDDDVTRISGVDAGGIAVLVGPRPGGRGHDPRRLAAVADIIDLASLPLRPLPSREEATDVLDRSASAADPGAPRGPR